MIKQELDGITVNRENRRVGLVMLMPRISCLPTIKKINHQLTKFFGIF